MVKVRVRDRYLLHPIVLQNCIRLLLPDLGTRTQLWRGPWLLRTRNLLLTHTITKPRTHTCDPHSLKSPMTHAHSDTHTRLVAATHARAAQTQ